MDYAGTMQYQFDLRAGDFDSSESEEVDEEAGQPGIAKDLDAKIEQLEAEAAKAEEKERAKFQTAHIKKLVQVNYTKYHKKSRFFNVDFIEFL